MTPKPRKGNAQHRRTTSWGSAGVGTTGPCIVEIDEALNGSDHWRLNVDSPKFYLTISVNELSELEQLKQFLGRSKTRESGSISLGGSGIEILKDDETAGRFFLLMRAESDSVMRIVLLPEDADQLSRALEAALADAISRSH